MDEAWKKSLLRVWLAIVGAATLVLGASYAMVQQSARLAADEQPLTALSDAKQKLSEDIAPNEVVPDEETDLREDSSVFVIITDENKKVIASSALLDGQSPLPTKDVFARAEQAGKDNFTWEPKKGVRHAVSIQKFDDNAGGYILAGKSLKETEQKIVTYTQIAVFTWLGIVILTMLMLFPQVFKTFRMPRRKK